MFDYSYKSLLYQRLKESYFFLKMLNDNCQIFQQIGLVEARAILSRSHLFSLHKLILFLLFSCYKEALDLGVVPRDYIVGTGNGLKRNKVLRDSIERAFGMKIQITRHDEEAGIGAAMCSAVAGGVYSSIQNASEKFLTKV